MGTDLSIRPAGPLATVAVATPPPSVAAADAVATDLPPSQTVTAVQPVAAAQLTPDTRVGARSRDVILDPDTASLVYRVVDSRTRTVVTQFPEEATLRRRAYFRVVDALKEERASGTATDRRA